ncbi:MAG: MBL fold metallo-hydrolase [FCB group bacterium]|nr:MBL fold metallo-hydrolase [FCB group bacterium]
MKIIFYGTRGSIPVADRDFIQVGGNTSCILVIFKSGEIAILDAGTGIRKLGHDLRTKMAKTYGDIFIGLSHTHWDHIQGFPFFKPAYDPDQKLIISLCGRQKHARDLSSIFAAQMQRDYFPVSFDNLQANIVFFEADTEIYRTRSGATITAAEHRHPGGAWTYRIEEQGKVLIYCTDIEHSAGIDMNIVRFSSGADLLIHDAQYTSEELKSKAGWGHSSWDQAVEVADLAGVKRLALFHHDPEHDDTYLFDLEKKYQRHHPHIFLARETLSISL